MQADTASFQLFLAFTLDKIFAGRADYYQQLRALHRGFSPVNALTFVLS
jgi:hypothetical protein